MYSNRFVVAIKVNGQILRESDDAVALPFGSEYSILLKNLDAVGSQVRVTVDGQDAADGLIIHGNRSMELERFIRNGNMQSGNRFRFIERTEGIEQHRGVQVDDGLIRVEFQFEQPKPEVQERIIREQYIPTHFRPVFTPRCPPYPRFGLPTMDSRRRGPSASPQGRPGGPMGSSSRAMKPASASAGITVPGSQSNQQFRYVQSLRLQEQKHVIVLRLVGMIGGEKIAEPVTVKTRATCNTCGKTAKSDADFCAHCGTALRLI